MKLNRPNNPLTARRNGARGFTLMELMVVVALVVVLTTGMAYALRGNAAAGVSFQSAQQQIAAMVEAARRQAMVDQTSARLLIAADRSNSDTYFRQVWIARYDADRELWMGIGESYTLPHGIWIVPPTGSISVDLNEAWPAANRSVLNVTGGTTCHLEYWPDGTLAAGATRIVVASTQITGGGELRFGAPGTARVLLLRPGGGVTFESPAVEE